VDAFDLGDELEQPVAFAHLANVTELVPEDPQSRGEIQSSRPCCGVWTTGE
jgi:hypothetical protein